MIRPSGPEWSFSKTNPEPQLVVWPATQNTREHQQVYTMSYISPPPRPTTTIAFLTRAYCRIHHHRRDRCLRQRAQGNRWAPLRGLLCGAHCGAQDEGIGLKAFHRKFGRPKMSQKWKVSWLMMGDDGLLSVFKAESYSLFGWFKKNTRELGTWICVSLWLRFSQVYAFGITIHADSYSYLNLLYFQNVRNPPGRPIKLPYIPCSAVPPWTFTKSDTSKAHCQSCARPQAPMALVAAPNGCRGDWWRPSSAKDHVGAMGWILRAK